MIFSGSDDMNGNSSVIASLILGLSAAVAIAACDRGDTDAPDPDKSPPADEESILDDPQGDESIVDDDSDGDPIADDALPPADKADQDPAGGDVPDAHAADLPEATEDQQDLYIRARTAFLNDQYEEAEELFEELAFKEPVTGQTVSAAIALGQIYIETGRPDDARQMYHELYDHVGDIPEVLLVLARVYSDLDEMDLALSAYDRAFELQPDYIFILPDMAQILVDKEKEEKAAELLRQYEERIHAMAELLEDTDESSDEDRFYVVQILGLVYDERAHTALEHALVQDPKPAIRTEAAVSLGAMGVVDARQTLEEAAVEDDKQTVQHAARHSLEKLREMESMAPDK